MASSAPVTMSCRANATRVPTSALPERKSAPAVRGISWDPTPYVDTVPSEVPTSHPRVFPIVSRTSSSIMPAGSAAMMFPHPSVTASATRESSSEQQQASMNTPSSSLAVRRSGSHPVRRESIPYDPAHRAAASDADMPENLLAVPLRSTLRLSGTSKIPPGGFARYPRESLRLSSKSRLRTADLRSLDSSGPIPARRPSMPDV